MDAGYVVDDAGDSNRVGVGNPRWLSKVGALLIYGPNTPELFRQAAGYVDKILQGAKPADLPMQQPATFGLIINRNAAKILGLTLPPTLQIAADEVIE
jgi:putative ABC transport system substrate-binding protein